MLPVRKKRKEKKRKRKEKKKKERKEEKKRKRKEENPGAARSAAGGQARGACPSRRPRAHRQLPAIPAVQRPPGAGVAGTASGRQ